ncbi:ABC-three component system protein [Geodermatophilus amargosae]|uniref:ABC-three component system protein n=1 Tax=Geodermatophilus amargosae TaxID=1296565 RepID=UPI0034DF4E07
MAVAGNQFSAAGPALGYLAQVDYALVLLLQRMDTNVDLAVSIETLEDIVFEDATSGDAKELLQSKHHVGKAGSLGDASPDIWKTLHNWIVEAVPSEDISYILLSTAKAPTGSAAAALTCMLPMRDCGKAAAALEASAQSSTNVDNQAYYKAYLDLEPSSRCRLLDRVFVIDGWLQADDIAAALDRSLRKSVTGERRAALAERLRGWWQARTIRHLTLVASGTPDAITMVEVENQLHYIRQALRDDDLPLDYATLPEPSPTDLKEDDRVFVEQLRLVSLHSSRIRQAVYDHNRAFLQRSRWQRERLLHINELAIYDQRLIDEWRRHFLPEEEGDERASTDEDEMRRKGRSALLRLQSSALPEVRSAVQSGYVPHGSLHLLADQLRIGWHPEWIDRLRHLVDAAGNYGDGRNTA